MNASLVSLAACTVLAAAPFASHAQTAAPADTVASACVSSLGTGAFERRVAAKARQGVASLRDYLFITRGLHNVSMEEALAWVDPSRGCGAPTASVASSR